MFSITSAGENLLSLKSDIQNMKKILLIGVICFLGLVSFGQNEKTKISIPDVAKKIDTLETACGQCKLGLPGKSCDLAVRIKDKAYFVDGTSIDEHGNAHAKDGFCNAIRKAEVQGEIVDSRFKVTYFKLISKPENKTTNH